MGRRVRRTVAVLGMASISFLGFNQQPAFATYASVMLSTGNHYDCTNMDKTGCAQRGTVPAGQNVRMNCWIDDSYVAGSARWFYVTTSTGVKGFVHSSRVGKQETIPNCKDQRGVIAARRAAMQLGELKPNEVEKLGNTNMDRWSGWCYVFVRAAHVLSHGTSPLTTSAGTALGAYQEYDRRGLVSKTLDANAISVGSLVFWTNVPGGHAAIYVGNGFVASTQGGRSDYKPNHRVALLSGPNGKPAGWVSPGNI